MPNIKPAQVDYLYRGAQGQPIRIMRRVQTEEGKKFYPVDPATGKKTTWDITKGDPGRVPYRLPEFLKAQASGAPIIIVEGEKCVDALAALGWLGVTTTPFGSNGFKGAALESLLKPYISTESSYIIIPDCDKPGRKYAYNMAEALTRLGCHAATLDLNKDRYDGYDIADWIDDQTGKYSNAEKLELFLGLLDLAEPFELPPPEQIFHRPADALNVELDIPLRLKLVIDHVTRNGVFHNGFLDALMRRVGSETRRFNDRDWNTLWHELPFSEDVKRSIGSKNYFLSIIESEYLPTTNPVQDWIYSLRWDGQDHIAALATQLHSIHEPDLVVEIIRQWLASVIAAITKNFIPQGMLILTGNQGIGKSTFLRHLCPPQIRDYYSETMIDLHNKDGLECLADNIIINVSELASFQRADYNTLKGFLTLSSVKYRKSYGHFACSRVRKASFCGDTNDDYFLSDPTGNRRFWVIKLDPANPNPIDDIPEYCGDQIWAQALAQRDEILAGNRDFIARMLAHAENFYQEPDIASAFQDIFGKPEEGDIGIEYLSATEILGEIHDANPGVRGSAIALGKEMKRMGFELPTLTRKNGVVKREWMVKRIKIKQETTAGTDYPSDWQEV